MKNFGTGLIEHIGTTNNKKTNDDMNEYPSFSSFDRNDNFIRK